MPSDELQVYVRVGNPVAVQDATTDVTKLPRAAADAVSILTKADAAAVSPTTIGLGGEGTVAGVTEDDALETVPVPNAFVALTRNVYA